MNNSFKSLSFAVMWSCSNEKSDILNLSHY